uniref:Uncharacterized protein n=1 Tax=Lutzomyia longipalpis TaxID=7200 RepID=A0A1B0CWH8_LUTLO
MEIGPEKRHSIETTVGPSVRGINPRYEPTGGDSTTKLQDGVTIFGFVAAVLGGAILDKENKDTSLQEKQETDDVQRVKRGFHHQPEGVWKKKLVWKEDWVQIWRTEKKQAWKQEWKKIQVPIWKTIEVPIWKEIQVPDWKIQKVPAWKEVQVPIWKEEKVPDWKKITKPIWKEIQVPVWKEIQVPDWKQIWVPEWVKVGIPGEKYLGKDHHGWEYTSHDLWKKN